MKIATTLFLFVVVGCTWREALGTCVFQSDFGFVLNCAFKKSGLFRVRNLGGVKGYVGLGFSVGDELGFSQSLSNLESAKRRSVQANRANGSAFNPSNTASNRDDARTTSLNNRSVVPPFKPLPVGAARPMAQQPERQKLVVQQNATAIGKQGTSAMQPLVQQEITALRQQQQRMHQEAKLKQQQRMQQEALALQVLKQQRLQQQEAMRQQQVQKLQQHQRQQQLLAQQPQSMVLQRKTDQANSQPQVITVPKLPNIVAAIPSGGQVVEVDALPSSKTATNMASLNGALPPFVAMPPSSAKITDRISNSGTLLQDSDNEVSKDDYSQVQLPLPSDEMAASVNEMTLLSLQPVSENGQSLPFQYNDKRQTINIPSLAPIQGMETSLKTLAEASNITLEALETAILLKQQQILKKQQGPTTTTSSTTTTTAAPLKKYNSGATKVMNAPREYYPVGYDKNFDDNFASRVDLPDTSFYCGDQKHFPGLYADEDLGCMVFHVCALTDDGLIMKSFLCPESTLFDQTILKCNWWFYVDCKASKSLYDSNIPISKSYQLMKALAFFSAYKNHDNGTSNADEASEEDSS
ncbi:uncharacterized protein LOC105187125 isoform X2 [Harpegnathos saltator]|uniref:uncharacterized protein LOC105187125 isoform X2 n=1 Tax=Harpegnathos saltator TaxID=610380 RepID=UPI00058E35BA|nr:uncharacterized protein LOC105187125 isoform X2 [Harpegnathos saltator]